MSLKTEIEQNSTQKLYEYILSKPKDEIFSFDSVVNYARKEKITNNKLLVWFICLGLEIQDLIEIDRVNETIISNRDNLNWAWNLAIKNCEEDGVTFSDDYLDLVNKNKKGEISHYEMRKRIKM